MSWTRHHASWKVLAVAAVAAALVLWIAACNSGNNPTEPVASIDPGGSGDGGSGDDGGSGGSGDSDGSGQNARLTIELRDLPSDEICVLAVYFDHLRVKRQGESQTMEELPLEEGMNPVDLLLYQDGAVAVLSEQFPIQEGRYQFIEIHLDEDRSHVVERAEVEPGEVGDGCPLEGEEPATVPLQIPSEKFKVNGGPFDVAGETTVLIHFDVDKSLKRKGSQNNPKGWQLNPDVSIENVTVVE